MSLRPAAIIIVLGLVLSACTGDDEGADTIDVSGRVLAGPTCPVVQDPPDPACEDRPVPDAELVVRDVRGTAVKTVRTDAAGRFATTLAPGEYVLDPQPVAGLLGTAEGQRFTVAAVPIDLLVVYDTGIRSPVPAGPPPP